MPAIEDTVFDMPHLLEAGVLLAFYNDEEKLAAMKKMVDVQPHAAALIKAVLDKLKREEDQFTIYRMLTIMHMAFILNEAEMPTISSHHINESFMAHMQHKHYYNGTPHENGKEPDAMHLLPEGYPRRDVLAFVEQWMADKPEDADDPDKLKEAKVSREVVFSMMKVIMDAYTVNLRDGTTAQS